MRSKGRPPGGSREDMEVLSGKSGAQSGQKAVEVACILYELGFCVRTTGRLEEANYIVRSYLSLSPGGHVGSGSVADGRHPARDGCMESTGRSSGGRRLVDEELSGYKRSHARPGFVFLTASLYESGGRTRYAGRLKEAEELLRPCLVIEEGKLGQAYAEVAFILSELGVCVQTAGSLEETDLLLQCYLKMWQWPLRCTSSV